MSTEPPMIFAKRQVAEFNTSQDTLRQIATMEWNIDEMFRMVYNDGLDKSDIGGIKNIFHYLTYVYADRLYAFSWPRIHPVYKQFEEELEKLYYDWIKNHPNEVPTQLLRRLRDYKRWLYEVKQKQIKLGVPTREETTAEQRMKRAAGI